MPLNNVISDKSNRTIANAVIGAYDSMNGDFWSDSIIGQFLYPGAQQEKEFGEQVALQQYQNEWNSEQAKMARMKEAGINVNAAAAGIAGVGSTPSVGSPNSAIGSGAAGVASAAQAAQSVAGFTEAASNAYEKFSLTGVEKDRRKAEIRDLLSSALHNDWLAISISEMLPLQKENERADTYLKLANFDKAKEEKNLIIKRVSEAEAHINEMTKQADLYEKQGNLVEAEKLRVNAQTEQIQLENDKLTWDKNWREKYKYDPNAPVDVALEQAMVNDASDDVVSAIGNSVKRVSYEEKKGVNTAEIEDAFDKAFNQVLGKNEANAEYAEFFADVDAWKQIFVDLWKNTNENPSDIQGVIAKALNSILTLLDSYKVTYNHQKPKPRPVVRQ